MEEKLCKGELEEGFFKKRNLNYSPLLDSPSFGKEGRDGFFPLFCKEGLGEIFLLPFPTSFVKHRMDFIYVQNC